MPGITQLVEFRNYRLVPGGLDDFVEHFERRFLGSQEALGMDIVGQLRLLDEPDRFVWVRRYLDPARRVEGLTSFYTGPVWKEHGPRANELLVDHTDVHLLEPDASAPTFAADHVPHDQRSGTPLSPSSTLVAAIYAIAGVGRIPPELAAAMDDVSAASLDVSESGRLVTSPTENGFPALPVHDTAVALWLLSDPADGQAGDGVARAVADLSGLPVTLLHLAPTARSTLR